MKKAIMIMITFVVALGAGVKFSQVDTKQYTGPEGHYTLTDVGEDPDYRAYFGGEPSNNDIGCRTGNYYKDARKVTKDGSSAAKSGYEWFENSVDVKANDLAASSKTYCKQEITGSSSNKKLTIKNLFKDDDKYIVSPGTAILLTKTVANDCTNMELLIKPNGNNKEYYIVTITNMTCWYCDIARRKASENKNEETLHGHTVAEFGDGKHTFNSGNVLGLANKNTIITIHTCDADKKYKGYPESLKDFYNAKKSKTS